MSFISTVSRRALSVLDDCGWAQGSCSDPEGRVCMGTALCMAAGLPLDGKLTPGQLTQWVALTDAVLEAQRELFPDAPFGAASCVPKFNDFSPAEDVRRVLEVMSLREDDVQHQPGDG